MQMWHCAGQTVWAKMRRSQTMEHEKRTGKTGEQRMNRNLDGIYLRIKRDNKWQSVCLSDMTVEELEENLNSERGEWLKGAVIHLTQTLHAIGDQFGIERAEE
jgi:hypothetical protein